MAGPARKGGAVTHVQDRLKTSDRPACASLGQPRSIQRYEGPCRSAGAGLIQAMRRIAEKETRAGFRSVARCLNREGWMVNINGCTDSGNRRASECLRGSVRGVDRATRPMAATPPVSIYRRFSSLSFRVKIRKGSRACMREDFFNALLHLGLTPFRMQFTESCGFEFPSGTVQAKRGAEPLGARRVA
jgi:hypothetical protein